VSCAVPSGQRVSVRIGSAALREEAIAYNRREVEDVQKAEAARRARETAAAFAAQR